MWTQSKEKALDGNQYRVPSEDKHAECNQQEDEEELTSPGERVTQCTVGVTRRQLSNGSKGN